MAITPKFKPGQLVQYGNPAHHLVGLVKSTQFVTIGWYGILAKTINKGNYITHDVVFPNGTRCIFLPLNWEVVSYAG